MKLFILGILGYCILEMSSAGPTQWMADEWWNQAQIVVNAQLGPLPKDIATYGSVVKLWDMASGGKSTNTHTLDIETAGNFFYSMITSISPILSSHYYAMFQQIFESLDSNVDNRIDFTEFTIILNIFAMVEARMVIAAYDENDNNGLDRVEVYRMMDYSKKFFASNLQGNSHYIIEQFEKPPISTILKSDHSYWSSRQLVELFIGMWEPLALRASYQRLEKKLCVPNNRSHVYTDKYSAMMDCVQNKKCAMIHNRGCKEDGKASFQLCTGIFRDLRGNPRQQPLPSSRSCVLVKKVF